MRKLLLEIRKIIKIKILRRQLGKQLRIRNKENYSWKLYFLLFLFIIFTLGYFNTAILIIFVNFFHQKSSLCLFFFTIFCYSFFLISNFLISPGQSSVNQLNCGFFKPWNELASYGPNSLHHYTFFFMR
jgi:hypothetical protein